MAYEGTKANIRINTDLAKIRSEAERLRTDRKQYKQFEDDPVSFLARFGIELDSETLNTVQSHLTARRKAAGTGAAQASIVHIDL